MFESDLKNTPSKWESIDRFLPDEDVGTQPHAAVATSNDLAVGPAMGNAANALLSQIPTSATSSDAARPDPFAQLAQASAEPALANLFGYLSHKDQVATAKSSHAGQDAAGKAPVEGSRTTLDELNGAMKDFQLTGYHSSAMENAPSLYQGLSTEHFGANTHGTGQLGEGFYLFPNEDRPLVDGKRQSQRDAERYGDGNAFRVFTKNVLNQGGGNILDRKGASDGQTWPKDADLSDAGAEGFDAFDKYPYLHPQYDAVTDHYEGGGMREMKIAPHVYDESSHAPASEALAHYPEGPSWRDDHPPVGGETNYAQDAFHQHVVETGVQIAPPHNPEGFLGRDFLSAIKPRE